MDDVDVLFPERLKVGQRLAIHYESNRSDSTLTKEGEIIEISTYCGQPTVSIEGGQIEDDPWGETSERTYQVVQATGEIFSNTKAKSTPLGKVIQLERER